MCDTVSQCSVCDSMDTLACAAGSNAAEEALHHIIRGEIKNNTESPVTFGHMLKGIYYLTLAKFFQPNKYELAKLVYKESLQLAKDSSSTAAAS